MYPSITRGLHASHMYLLSFHFVRTCVTRTSAGGLPLSLSRYFIDCGRFPTGGDEWGYDVAGIFFSSLRSLFLREDETNKEREREKKNEWNTMCMLSLFLALLPRLLGLLILPWPFCFSCRSTHLTRNYHDQTMLQGIVSPRTPQCLMLVRCECWLRIVVLWSLSSAGETTFVVVLSREVGETFHRSTTGHRL